MGLETFKVDEMIEGEHPEAHQLEELMKKNPDKETEEEKLEGRRNTTRFGITKSREKRD